MSLYDELTSGLLAQELAPLVVAGNDGAILDVLNRKDIQAKGKISAHDIQQYLMLKGLLLTIEAGQSDSCKAAKRCLELFKTIDLGNAEILATFSTVLTGLEMDNLVPAFTAQHKADLLAMGDVLISRAEQVGINPTLEQIRSEIWNNDGSRKL